MGFNSGFKGLSARKIYYLYLGLFLDRDDEIFGFLRTYHCLIPNKLITCHKWIWP